MICPTCRYCQDHHLPHLCITCGGTLQRLLSETGDEPAVLALAAELARHPAAPVDWTAITPTVPTVRAVHWTWCDCGCEDRPATPTQHTRTREAQPA